MPLAHLDRPFDYAVPATMAETAVPGARVKVRFAGQDVDGYVVARAATTDHPGLLANLRRVVSPEPVLTPEIAALTADVAQRYAGTRSDVLRLAVPARHATTEKEPSPPGARGAPFDARAAPRPGATTSRARPSSGTWPTAGAPRAVWGAAPGTDWPHLLAHAAAAAYASGRGALRLRPRRQGRRPRRPRAHRAAGRRPPRRADRGRRPRAPLPRLPRGQPRRPPGRGRHPRRRVRPVRDLGLVVIWDDGDDLHAEPRAPYPHTRETLLLRAEREGTAVLVGGFARTVEAEYLLRTGWARELSAPREVLRERRDRDGRGRHRRDLERDPHARGARIPTQVHEAIRAAWPPARSSSRRPAAGTPRPLACERCRTPARCAACAGPLALTGPTTPPACRWCGTVEEAWACRECGHRGLRAPVLGDARTAEELGRSFPQDPGPHLQRRPHPRRRRRLARRGRRDAGAEPVAAGGYAAVVLLDTWLMLARADLRTDEEALRRWSNAAGLVRPGGRAIVVGDPATPRSRRWSAGTSAASPPGRPRSGSRRTCRPRPGWRRSPATRAPSTTP